MERNDLKETVSLAGTTGKEASPAFGRSSQQGYEDLSRRPFESTYRIERLLGKGGMGCVYLARHLRLNTCWAIKEVRKSAGGGADLLAEANILKKLSHPSLPRIVDIYEDSQRIYIVEDYIEGVSLDKYLLQRSFEEPVVRKWAAQLCAVLSYLHSQRPHPVIFRDMKPGNIMVTPSGDVKLIDFGIAREYKRDCSTDTSYLGTRGYAAPEQFGTAQTDARTDIYSLGATLYHILTGKSPNEPPYKFVPVRSLAPRVSEGMERIIAKCVKADPAERYQSAAELNADLARIDSFSRESRARRVKKAVIIAACSIFAAGAVTVGILLALNAKNERAESYSEAFRQGAALIAEGSPEEGIALLEQTDESSGGAEGRLTALAALLNAGSFESCAQRAEYYASQDSELKNSAQLNYCWGASLKSEGDYDGALQKLELANELEPENVTYMRELAHAYAKAGSVYQAKELLERVKKISDDDAAACVYAQILAAEGKYQSAEAEYQSCVSSEDESVRRAAMRGLCELYEQTAESSDASADSQIAALEALMKAFPEQESVYCTEKLAKAWYVKGTLTDSEDSYERSLKYFQDIASSGYARVSTYTNTAIVLQKLNRYDEAESALMSGIELNPNDAGLFIQLAFLAAERQTALDPQQRDYSDVQKWYEKAKALGASGESFQRLEGIISDLKAGGWI